jgi:hypothetical protein
MVLVEANTELNGVSLPHRKTIVTWVVGSKEIIFNEYIHLYGF